MTDQDSTVTGGSALPWPDGWRRTRRRADAYAAKGVDAVRAVDVDTGGLREPGVLLPMRAVPMWWAVLFGGLGLAFVAGAVVLAAAAFAEQQWSNLVGVVVLGAFGAVFSLSAIAVARRRRDAVPGLRLTPGRIVFDGGAAQSPVSIRWDQMHGIRLFTNRYGYRAMWPRPWHNWLSLEVNDPPAVLHRAGHRSSARLAQRLRTRGAVAIADARWLVDAVVVYHCVRYYLENPDRRGELASGEAVSRVRRGALHGGLS